MPREMCLKAGARSTRINLHIRHGACAHTCTGSWTQTHLDVRDGVVEQPDAADDQGDVLDDACEHDVETSK